NNDNLSINDKNLTLLLNSMDNIIDILELPSLTNACVKSGYYSESLQINSYIKQLSTKYQNIPLISSISIEINKEISYMLSALIRLLRSDLKQSTTIKVLSYIRKILPFNDSISLNKNLKRIYLHSRYLFIINELSVLNPLKSHSTEKFIKRSIEVIREYCFSSIITFQTIFPSNNQQPDKIDNTQLLYGFIKNIIIHLILILRENFPKIIDIQIRDSLLLQIVYCSQSLGRIGGEFSSLLLNFLNKNKSGIITDSEWCKVLKKQKSLIKNFK
ncbi:Golgi transport complex subunit COG8, partial [Ascoidea rubescens DSM 1968]